MAIEWARLKAQETVEVDRGIFLRGSGGCHVLLLHGLTGCPAELGYLAHWLRNRGHYHVSCPRLVNHGQPIGILARTRWTELYESAKAAFLEARAAARAEGLPLVVGGLSLGAHLSMLLAAEFPRDVAGAACLAPTLFYDGWSVPWYQRLIPLVDYTPLKYFAYLREDEPFGLRDEALRAKIAARYRKMSLHDCGAAAASGYAHFPVRLFCEMRRLIQLCKQTLPEVSCPVLVVQAERDDVTSPRNAEYIMSRVGSAKRELVLLKQSYHLVSADLERTMVAKRLQEFCGAFAVPRHEARNAERMHAQIAA